MTTRRGRTVELLWVNAEPSLKEKVLAALETVPEFESVASASSDVSQASFRAKLVDGVRDLDRVVDSIYAIDAMTFTVQGRMPGGVPMIAFRAVPGAPARRRRRAAPRPPPAAPVPVKPVTRLRPSVCSAPSTVVHRIIRTARALRPEISLPVPAALARTPPDSKLDRVSARILNLIAPPAERNRRLRAERPGWTRLNRAAVVGFFDREETPLGVLARHYAGRLLAAMGPAEEALQLSRAMSGSRVGNFRAGAARLSSWGTTQVFSTSDVAGGISAPAAGLLALLGPGDEAAAVERMMQVNRVQNLRLEVAAAAERIASLFDTVFGGAFETGPARAAPTASRSMLKSGVSSGAGVLERAFEMLFGSVFDTGEPSAPRSQRAGPASRRTEAASDPDRRASPPRE